MAQNNGDGYAGAVTERRVAGPASEREARPYQPYRSAPERPIGELLQELGQDARNLVSLEVELAKTELAQKAAQAGKATGFIAAGGFVIYAGFLAIVFAIIVLLANFIAPWLSALVVGVVVALIGYAVVRKGMNDLKGDKLAPRQTIETVKEDKEWVQNQTH
jgi:xanthine/uracil permease